jgi:hypothetical protein
VENIAAKPSRSGAGRPKGSRNRVTKVVKDAILKAFEEVGSDTYLATVAREDPRTFCALLGKVIPLQVKGEVNGTVGLIPTIVIKADDSPDASTS